jgi:hypothetical protein
MLLSKYFYRLTHWETWHYLAKYIPIMPVWLWHCLKARSLWFFTPSNPTLTFGGFEGESKKEMYEQLPPGSYPKSIFITTCTSLSELRVCIAKEEFTYPFAVKPDVGMMGLMFRHIHNERELFHYHREIGVDYFIQELVTYPLEVSVFYYRFPYEEKGTITGFLKKEFLEVVGDGESSLWQLIQNYERVQFRLEEMRAKHASMLELIIPAGKIYILSHALNLSRGGRLVSLEHQKSESLLKVFDDLSLYTKHFYYGRYDIKCKSVEELQEGKHFSILEYNGCGAEPHHIYGNGNSILQAYKIVLDHWSVLYRISKYNNDRGFRYWGFKRGLLFLRKAKKHFKTLKEKDQQFPAN